MEDWKRALLEQEPESYRNESGFGPISGISVGATWANREDCARDRMHVLTSAGISGGKNGAYSIVVSGGYADDIDKGEEILYTGTGGFGDQNKYGGNSGWGGKIQVEDQSLDHSHNKPLVISYQRGTPVRVIRGYNLPSKYAPIDGYRYDGIYKVIDVRTEKSKDGFQICRFKLRREPGQPSIPTRY